MITLLLTLFDRIMDFFTGGNWSFTQGSMSADGSERRFDDPEVKKIRFQ